MASDPVVVVFIVFVSFIIALLLYVLISSICRKKQLSYHRRVKLRMPAVFSGSGMSRTESTEAILESPNHSANCEDSLRTGADAVEDGSKRKLSLQPIVEIHGGTTFQTLSTPSASYDNNNSLI